MSARGACTPGRHKILLIFIFLTAVHSATTEKILFVLTPGWGNQLLSMRELAQELASRQHSVLVRHKISFYAHCR